MDKSKPGPRRGIQPKARAFPPSAFIPLGSKSTASSGRQGTDLPLDPKLGIGKSTAGSSSIDRKRDVSSTSSAVPKRPKLGVGGTLASIGRGLAERKDSSLTDAIETWEALAIEVPGVELVDEILTTTDEERIESVLCGAVKQLKLNRAKPEPILYIGLIYLIKSKSTYFCFDLVIEALASLLKRDISLSFKTKGNNLVSILAANLILAALHDDLNWPEILVKVFIDDSLGERIWVDHPECKGFVDNILTAFGTISPTKSQLTSDLTYKQDCPSPTSSVGGDDDDGSDSLSLLECKEVMDTIVVQPRFTKSLSKVEKLALDIIKEPLNRKQSMEVSRNMLRLLTSCCGLSEVRCLAAQRLEIWLQNTKLMKPAQDLMMSICLNCREHNQHDVEVISSLTKIRIKGKPLVNHYLQCIREILGNHSENKSTLLKHTLYNELSNNRNPNNMAVISVVFQYSPESAAKMLAEIFQDLLMNTEDYLKALRALLREIVRTLRYDVPFTKFCLGLMAERKEQAFRDLDQSVKERMFLSLSDLITMTILLAISPAVKEAVNHYYRGDKKDLEILKSYRNQITVIQRDAVWWLHTVVMHAFKPGRNEFMHCLHKILFMEQAAEQYFIKDNWPPESERALMLRCASEMPVLEDTLMRVFIIGLSKDNQISYTDAIELADQLVRRAAALHVDGYPVLQVEHLELIELLFRLCIYHHPESITLPQGYQPPSLAISKLYWKAWIILLIVISHNPGAFSVTAWQTYATIRMLIEMCITNHFTFPPPTFASGEKAEEIKSKEIQLSQLEKQEILQFETHLAAASSNVAITEDNSLLLTTLTTLDPQGIIRRPPTPVLEQLKLLNHSMKLGHLLCSRNPDFLLDIIQRQGTSESMPWLAELVESSAGSFNMLPIQCLCEFLIHDSIESNQQDVEDREESKAEKVERARKKLKQKKQKQLLQHLKSLLNDVSSNSQSTCEILDYFLRRLTSKQAGARTLAAKGLRMVLSSTSEFDKMDDEPVDDDEDCRSNSMFGWVSNMTLLPNFKFIKRQAGLHLRQACLVENDPAAVGAYIKFLCCYHPADTLQDVSDLALDIAHILVNRTTLVNYLLPSNCNHDADTSVQSSFIRIYLTYLPRALKIAKDAYSWSISQDQVLIQWSSGYAATMHILVAHAMVVLLTYGPPADNSTFFDSLLEYWFPSEGESPQAFLVDTSEPALLFPDWLKLRMISSKVDRLVDAALKDLEAGQLVLFVQSFGIPVTTVSKLLFALDIGAQVDAESLKQAVVDKSYMCQLVDIQQQRGATSGYKFVEILSEYKEQKASLEETIDVVDSDDEVPLSRLSTMDQLGGVKQCLLKVFEPSNMATNERRSNFDCIIKAISQDSVKPANERTVVKSIISSIYEILFSNKEKLMIKGFHEYSSYTCSLFCLLFNCQADHERMACYLPLVELILSKCIGMKSLFINLLRKHSAKIQGTRIKEDSLESESKKIMQNSETVSGELVIKMTKALNLNFCDETSVNEDERRWKLGTYTDQLELVEPEILKSCPELEKDLLFGMQAKKDGRQSCRQYLLALLIHQTNWTTIHRVINLCLSDNINIERMDPSAVLDFLWACNDIPRIWQGQDKSKSKHDVSNSVLVLNESQVCCIVDYVIREVIVRRESSVETSNHQFTIPIISARIPLLLKCISDCRPLAKAVVKHMVKRITDNSKDGTIWRQLLMSLYSQLPHIIFFVDQDGNRRLVDFNSNDILITQMGISSLDSVSHSLMTALASTSQGKQGTQTMKDLEIECRKMAFTHPLLLLRQLSMIASSLHGRVNFEYSIFCSKNNMGYFSCIMGLMELMQPFIFHHSFEHSLKQIIGIYFEFIQIHGFKNKQTMPLIQKFVNFLYCFANCNLQAASLSILKYLQVLDELLSKYPEMPKLKSIISSLSASSTNLTPSFETELKPEEPSRNMAQVPADVHARNTSYEWDAFQLAHLKSRLSSRNPDDILLALHDLDNVSQRNPSMLGQVSEPLRKLLSSNHSRCRDIAYDLTINHLKHEPNCSDDFLQFYKSCLDGDNPDVLISALEHLAEITIVNQERGRELLSKTFNIGISRGIDIKPYISETLFLLSMQQGM